MLLISSPLNLFLDSWEGNIGTRSFKCSMRRINTFSHGHGTVIHNKLSSVGGAIPCTLRTSSCMWFPLRQKESPGF
jgi:hypothetical protein